ncbi:unnamed protein product [Rotaria sp. Silwood1]|nr:unnamed protein product [Rotaria sp. Silwood1]CAF1236693.1 unnamed protein product [Rotaria sp. Silwood1]
MNGDIHFHNINFAYPTRSDILVLRNLTLMARAGEITALVGSNGSGKSTCISLLLRFYEPLSGHITINDQSITDCNIKQLRQKIGIVSQEPILFATSIYENIRFGKENATRIEIEEAACQANAHDFIMKLPNKYDTIVGERGVQLSGGEKQRVALARALVKQPALLLLDEATSALDNANEKIVQEALDQACKGRTTIVIAHRLATIQNAHHIYVLHNGHVIEEGTHEILMSQEGSRYHEMMKAQQREKTENDINEATSVIQREDDDQQQISQRSRCCSEKELEDGDKYTAFAISGSKLTERICTKAFAHYLRQEMAFFDLVENSSGTICNRLSSDALAIQQMFNLQLNLSICQSGQRVALIGESGCGKSTVIQLLERFYDPIQGRIYLDGVDIRQLNIQWLRSCLGLVSQEPILFDLTIAQNIAYGRENTSIEDIIDAATKANIHDFIQQLPQGYETKVGMKGGHLSGGEKQRIALARVLLRQPKILLLDEATSAMDSYNEQIVQEALEKAETDDPTRTSLIIAHRLSTIRSCDLICILDKGYIIESGTHVDLMEQRGVYYQMVKELQVIESLSLEQLRQLLDIINDLYNCHVIHRDICPQNLMLDYDTNHIKLIDFGCAITYDIDDKAGSIETRGTTIYAGLQILDVLAGISCDLTVGACYAYERTFDLQCSLNIIISMNNIDIKEKIYSFEILTDTHKTQLKILQFWKDTQRENQRYSNILNLTSWIPLSSGRRQAERKNFFRFVVLINSCEAKCSVIRLYQNNKVSTFSIFLNLKECS